MEYLPPRQSEEISSEGLLVASHAAISLAALTVPSRISAHSHTTAVRHPAACKALRFLRSRKIVCPNFSVQNFVFEAGVVANRQFP